MSHISKHAKCKIPHFLLGVAQHGVLEISLSWGDSHAYGTWWCYRVTGPSLPPLVTVINTDFMSLWQWEAPGKQSGQLLKKITHTSP